MSNVTFSSARGPVKVPLEGEREGLVWGRDEDRGVEHHEHVWERAECGLPC